MATCSGTLATIAPTTSTTIRPTPPTTCPTVSGTRVTSAAAPTRARSCLAAANVPAAHPGRPPDDEAPGVRVDARLRRADPGRGLPGADGRESRPAREPGRSEPERRQRDRRAGPGARDASRPALPDHVDRAGGGLSPVHLS